jgi:hypothetical protein
MESWSKEYGKATEIYARAFSRKFNLPLEDVMFQAWVVLTKELGVEPKECLLNQQDIQKMTCVKLKKQLKTRGLKSGGSKIELQHRLIAWSDHLKEIISTETDDSDDSDGCDMDE